MTTLVTIVSHHQHGGDTLVDFRCQYGTGRARMPTGVPMPAIGTVLHVELGTDDALIDPKPAVEPCGLHPTLSGTTFTGRAFSVEDVAGVVSLMVGDSLRLDVAQRGERRFNGQLVSVTADDLRIHPVNL